MKKLSFWGGKTPWLAREVTRDFELKQNYLQRISFKGHRW